MQWTRLFRKFAKSSSFEEILRNIASGPAEDRGPCFKISAIVMEERKNQGRYVKRRCEDVKSVVWKIVFYSNILKESEQHRVAFVNGRERATT